MKLGRLQSAPDLRALHLQSYLPPHLPTPPSAQPLEQGATWPMLANDRFNCCTSAAAGHMVHHWTAANGKAVVLTELDVIRAHAALTDDHLLDRVSMVEALKLWRNVGIGEHRIHSFVTAAPQNADHLRQVIYLFGAAYLGLDLPAFACPPDAVLWPTTPWSIPEDASPLSSAPQSENGHCVTAVGYSPAGITVITWGMAKLMTWEFYAKFNFETYAVLSKDWVTHDAKSPTGFYSEALNRDLEAVHILPAG